MDLPLRNSAPSLLFLCFCLLSTLTPSISTFSPLDNHLLSCGSSVDSTVDNRRFVSDPGPNSPLLSSAQTIPLSNPNPSPSSPQLYSAARVFKKPSKYAFKIEEAGTHMVRFHFFPFVSSGLDLKEARFHVLVNGYVVLSNFTVGNVMSPLIKEYFLWVDSDELVVTFVPVEREDFGFVNAIEVISAPKDLIADTAQIVNGTNKDETLNGLTRHALETVYRVNVGGSKVTPFNDTVWRTWVPDDDFFKSVDFTKRVYFSGRIKYQTGGASREVGPDFVYATGRVITSSNASIPYVNMTWEFPVTEGYKYLVRLHFCDIASISLGLLKFNVYVDGYLAYENLDLTSITYMLASPFYADFVVDGASSGVLSVSVGPSNTSMPNAVDGILNGLEIWKLNNSLGSLDGKMCAGMVFKTWHSGSGGVLLPLVAVLCLLLSLSMVIRRTKIGIGEHVAWTKLPTSVPEGTLKLKPSKV